MTAFLLAACGERPAGDAGTPGGAGTETGMPADTAPAPGAMDTAMTDTAPLDTAPADTTPR
jgi:hypothetical protein